MAQSTAQDFLVKDFMVLDSSTSVAEALKQLGQANMTYGVVPGSQTELPVLVVAEILLQTQDKQARLGDLVETQPHFVPIPPNVQLNQVISALIDELDSNPDLTGLVVWNDQQQVIGVITIQTMARVASRLLERGGEVTRLEGLPALAPAVTFYCSLDKQEKLVSYYDPDNPPRCLKGHLMKRKPLSR